jgi:predicted O-methyltransferase YrrM
VNIYSVLKYVEYIISSSHRCGHGIHSPFVFNLILNVFRNKTSPAVVLKIESIRKRLISSRNIISVQDFGTGSEKGENKLIKVSEIARRSSVPGKYCYLLAEFSREFGKLSVIEFGTSFGISTMYMAAANPGTIIYTMEGSPAKAEIARNNFREAGLMNIKPFTGSFGQLLPEIEKKGIKPGLVFIDGNHRKEPTLEYYKRMVSISDKNTVIILDDIYHSREMAEAWNEIKKDSKISLTIDIYRMGIVFFRGGMTRFDYKIRY